MTANKILLIGIYQWDLQVGFQEYESKKSESLTHFMTAIDV